MSLREYIIKVREAIDRFDTYGFSESADIREEIRAGKQAVIKIEVVLIDGSVLRIREYVEAKYQINKISYAYQYQIGIRNLSLGMIMLFIGLVLNLRNINM